MDKDEIIEEPEISLDDELGAVWDEAEAVDDVETEEVAEETRARGPDGKFVAKEAAPEEEADAEIAEGIQTDGVIGAEVEDEPETAAEIDAPASWSESAKAQWSRIAPEIRQILAEQETARTQADTQKDQWLREFSPVAQALQPIAQQLALHGVQPGQYVQQLVAADQYLRKDPQSALKWIAQQYGATLPDQYETDEDPSLTPLVSEITQLKSQLQGMQTAQEQAQTAQTQAQIDSFAATHPHFEKVRVQMGQLIQSGVAQDIQNAYDMAVWANPTTRTSLIAEQSKPVDKIDPAKKAAQARRIAATNLSSAGVKNGVPQTFDTIDDELGAAFDRAQGAS